MRKKWALSLFGLIIVAVYLFPIYWMVATSLKPTSAIFSDINIIPAQITLESYQNILTQNYPFLTYMKNSLIISVGVTVGNLLLGAPAAYALARTRITGYVWLIMFILIVQMFPSNMLALPLYTIFSKLGLINSLFGVILADMTLTLPFVILILRTSYLNIPVDLEDAASIDGCGKWRAFYSIILPLVRPGLLTCAAFSFILSWGEFLYALTFLKQNDMWTITLGMRQFVGQFGTNWGSMMALSALSSLPIIIIFMATQKYIAGGLSSGAVK
ncbi:sugar ABC transporter permease [Thalassobacillus devorans]|uniref:Sugar ABC transporter permease n=1 Tax=Thalassobacillus devorans TaxID=279813 RepID=A0ABQ1P2N9_9BACI|nr:carbohydrate ABC transporter permease [Thalassobacillus devorans]NIK28015.1 multiple sugar transport system permease protein [Thalassobacillus devorans]GGC89576.1 sugar ABC transporter permease [Thalassobacillus devorans]